MKFNRRSRLTGIAAVSVLALTLGACSGGSDSSSPAPGGSSEPGGSAPADNSALSGNLAGTGASSQEKAMDGWVAGFSESAPDVVVTYDPQGSGAGREQFLASAVQFAGSDAALSGDELTAAQQRCFGGEALELPVYISPIAVIYNLPGLSAANINLDAKTIAEIFDGKITSWNDAAIADQNPGVDLPATTIIPVHRSDESGTTENFTDYLAAASDGAWSYEASGTWPISGGQSGAKTQGMVDTVSGAEGAIGYADASRAGDLGTVAIKVGDAYVPYSAEAAAKVVDASPRAENATANRLVVELDRTTTEAGAYPLVLVSYEIACSTYDKQADVDNVKAFLTYIASDEGQARAADPSVAGSAPISAALHTEVQTAIDGISLAS
ncbi:phosphate ABC transporter substrate-binding protein PstS [Rarobacter faecitabidus]|uniref:Phosphate-binding protein n=1 Tax=Rarobacter faecitabidus TaxID=13243 RepID=A0A542ZTQ7_RARFA|nr:phosphate ABC transporter substrate-binding protein PstS [Rarobacter faecitabidus]TQL63697.1 phosphate ABC transporter substrate-binding protein (PhoT family) [Rarobacter faecitabidus]